MTGFGSLIDASNNPFACIGERGTTTFNPDACRK